MRMAPIISLVLSIVVGIAAVVFGRGWLNNQANATSNSPTVVLERVETRKILVADIAIERGALLTREGFRAVDWPIDHIPEGAVDNIQTITEPTGGLPYALGMMVPGEPLLAGKVSHRALRDTLPRVIEPGYRAMSIQVNDVTGVAGFILPDHRVDVNVFSRSTNRRTPQAKTLLENIRVLAVDQVFEENLEGTALARTVTLQVTPAEARALGLANEDGDLALVLRPKEEAAPATSSLATRTPQRSVVRTTPAKPKSSFANIRVIQGDSEQRVRAPVARSIDTDGAKN